MRSLDAQAKLQILSEVYQKAYKNVCNHFALNGELWLLDRLEHLPVEMIFYVGANHGEWAAAASARFANAVIHAFEIVPATYKYLEDVAHRIPHIRPSPFGLSDRTGSVDVGVWQDNDTVSSMFWNHHIRSKHGRSVVRCAVQRAEEYCRNHSIS